MSEIIKPCPFCNCLPNIDEKNGSPWCGNLECMVDASAEDLEAWNTRPIEDELNKRIAELEYDLPLQKAVERIAELEAAVRWIPVAERLPDDNDKVCAWDSHAEEPVTSSGAGVRIVRYYTHWRPMPQPPE